MSFLDKHPFPVEAFFEQSIVLGFAIPCEELVSLIPSGLELDLFEERWGFVAIALVKTRGLRPKGFPKMFGRDFTLIGYRVFVRYRGADGRRLRGLYILRSETDKPAMVRLGNVFTQYRYEHVSIDWQSVGSESTIQTSSGFEATIRDEGGDVVLPETSPFPSWREARRFAGPMPFTFSMCEEANEIVIVEGQRESWTPRPVAVQRFNAPLNKFGLHNPRLANAFVVEKVPYQWKRGRREQCPT